MNSPRSPGLLIAFDLDGTLVDSRRDIADAANELLAELGGAPLPEEAIGRMVGEGAAVLVRRVLKAAGHEPRESLLLRYLEIYDAHLLRNTAPYPGIVDAVEAARRIARVSVLTNKPLGATARILDGLGLRRLFDDVVGGDGPWPRKPDPSSLRELMMRAGATPSRTLLVGDSRIDLDTARAARARVCLARYGFGFEWIESHRLRGDEMLIDAPAQLTTLFAHWSSQPYPGFS